MKVAVFCSCSATVNEFFMTEIHELGRALAKDGHAVVYGGSSGGCMGALAAGVLKEKGQLIGVVPDMDFMDGRLQENLTEHHRVLGLSARKERMNDLADAFIIFPGGLGTLDEAFDVLALKSCGSLRKPVLFYNYMDVWTPLIETLYLLAQQNLIRTPIEELFRVVDKVSEVRENLRDGT